MRTPSDLDLEQIALGELDGAPFGVAAGDPRIFALRSMDATIRSRYPARPFALRVQMTVAARSRRTTRSITALLVPFAAALAFVIVRPADPLLEEGPDTTIIKGLTPDVQVLALIDGAVRPIERAAAGQRVQLSVVGAGASHGVLLSVDGRGGVTLHHPRSANDSTALPIGEALRLPDSFVLDDAPGFERFILVTSPRAIDVVLVLEAARQLAGDAVLRGRAPLALPAPLHQASRRIEKEPGAPR